MGERPAFLWVCGIIPLMAPEGFWKVEEAGGGRWGRVSQESTASDPPFPLGLCLPVQLYPICLSAVVFTECPLGRCFLLLSGPLNHHVRR